MWRDLWFPFMVCMALGLGVLLVLHTMLKQVDDDRTNTGKQR